MSTGERADRRTRAPGEAQWYKDAVIYELHVRSFQDSNADGIGDFPGLKRRLPYLQDLGVTALWLLPFYPSPLRDDGYDIADYREVHPDYGTLDDFQRFMDEAHRLGLRVITELVINHTSDQHAWFQRARNAPPGSPERGFYVWSDSPDRYGGARIIFPDFERSNWSWDPVADAYYWHRFYSHQPDLNYENPAVFSAVLAVLDHWFRLGVDGMRLDAIPYLIEREGTHSENLDATHAVVKRLRAHVEKTFGNRIFIAEANQWPEDAAAYFGDGDESQMVFHFPLMPRLFMAVRQEDRLPVLDILAQTPPPPAECQWALFLRNHDELTLEMVSEEERLYMYEVYATDAKARINLGIRRRLAPLLGNDRRRIELMNALLFSLPGTPVLYYGDELGMGDNIYLGDRNGVRTPMQWNGDRNAGFSDASPQQLFLPLIIDDEYHHQSVHVAQQLGNSHSLLSWMKRLIAARKRHQAFGRGELVTIDSQNVRVLSFVRRWAAQEVLVVANLSRFVQQVELDLRSFSGRVPVDVFGRTSFPEIGRDPYQLTLGPHGFLWLELTTAGSGGHSTAVPALEVQESWEELVDGRSRPDLEAILPAYVERCTAWNNGTRTVLQVEIDDAVRVGEASDRRWLLVLRVTFASGEPERYLLPLGARALQARARARPDTVARLLVRSERRRYELFDAAEDPALAAALLEHATGEMPLGGVAGTVERVLTDEAAVPKLRGKSAVGVERSRRGSNALVAIGGRVVLKLFRQLESGPHPEIEMRRMLRDAAFRHVPPIVAGFRWHSPSRPGLPSWIGVLQELVDNQGEAWTHAVSAAERYLRRAMDGRTSAPHIESLVPGGLAGPSPEPSIDRLIGSYAGTIARLGTCAADLHRALATPTPDPAFAPEVFTPFSRRSAYQRMRRSAVSVLDLLRARGSALHPELRELVDPVLDRRDELLAAFRALLDQGVAAARIRCHGNFHLGQILYAGDELVIIDFDGEPGRPLYERRLKRSPLQDVATMVRSFHYAGHAAIHRFGLGNAGDPDRAARWVRAWQRRAGALFLQAYARSMEGTGLLPAALPDAQVLFHAYLLERAIYEMGFELDRGSPWLRAPLSDLPLLLTVVEP